MSEAGIDHRVGYMECQPNYIYSNHANFGPQCDIIGAGRFLCLGQIAGALSCSLPEFACRPLLSGN